MELSRRSLLGAGLAASAVGLTGCAGDSGTTTSRTPSSAAATTASATPTPALTPTPTPTGPAVGTASGSAEVTGTVATGIDVPWGLASLPDGSVLITSRDDYLIHRLDLTTETLTTLAEVPGVVSNVDEAGEAGLLGIAVSPTYASDARLYLYYSTDSENRIAWAEHLMDAEPGKQQGPLTTIVDAIPHNVHHNGGRLVFGPDGMLYASTGEAEQPDLAQDKGSLGGKILRMTPDGEPVDGNPFGTIVFSYGHRNVQGLAFDADGRLFASEFGDKAFDELNLVVAGANYGWPDTQGRTDDAAYTSPIAEWGTEEDSPSGIAIAAGCVWMAALQGGCLWRIPLDGASVVADPVAFLQGDHGRLRSVLALDDATLLVTTSDRDGRSDPGPDDDQVLTVSVT